MAAAADTLPTEHAEHDDEDAADENAPEGQEVHVKLPGEAEYLPVAHSVHEFAPEVALNVPEEHNEHDDAPATE